MAMHKKQVDWEALELSYRTGQSFRLLSRQFRISSTRIKQVVDENGWTRDLTQTVAERTTAKLNSANLNTNLNGKRASERAVVEATVEVQVNVVLEHRANVRRTRGIVATMLRELEAEVERGHVYGKAARPNSADNARDEERRAGAFSARANSLRALTDALKTLIGLERQAFNIADGVSHEPEPQPRFVPATDGFEKLEEAFARVIGRPRQTSLHSMIPNESLLE